MAFEAKKFEDIYKEMVNRSTAVTDFSVGSVARTMYESFSFELALLYEKMHRVYLAGFVDTAEDMQLDQVVAVLGIKRGMPDYAEGVVRFERDAGNQPLLIPLNTLVATEEKPDAPKKAYITIEEKELLPGQTSIEVRIRAVERGEEQVTPKETVVSMPRPVPGLKSVINPEALLFRGKRRENDEDLRERAKNALMSSGKASKIAIENALLALEKVRDVRVEEPFANATGKIFIQGATGTVVPSGTSVTAVLKDGSRKTFFTTRSISLGAGKQLVDIRADIAGEAGAIRHAAAIERWHLEPGSVAGAVEAQTSDDNTPVNEFGVIDVTIDGRDKDDPEIIKEIERVRSAGIFVRRSMVEEKKLNGVFQITLNPNLNLGADDLAALEATVQQEITNFLNDLRMGEPLIYGQLIKMLLSIDGVSNLKNFSIEKVTLNEKGEQITGPPINVPFDSITVGANERLSPGNICVSTIGERNLIINAHFYIKGDINDASLTSVSANISEYLNKVKTQDNPKIDIGEVSKIISEFFTGTYDSKFLRVWQEPWCGEGNSTADGLINLTFIDKPVLGDLFAYNTRLDLIGGFEVSLPFNVQNSDVILKQVKKSIMEYIMDLKSEQKLIFEEIKAAILKVKEVLKVQYKAGDFKVIDESDTYLQNQWNDDHIALKKYQKINPIPKFICILDNAQRNPEIEIEFTNIDVKVSRLLQPFQKTNLAIAIAQKINTYPLRIGESIEMQKIKEYLSKASSQEIISISNLFFKATSLCNTRLSNEPNLSQESNYRNEKEVKTIFVRSLEKPLVKKFDPTNVLIYKDELYIAGTVIVSTETNLKKGDIIVEIQNSMDTLVKSLKGTGNIEIEDLKNSINSVNGINFISIKNSDGVDISKERLIGVGNKVTAITVNSLEKVWVLDLTLFFPRKSGITSINKP